MPPVFGPLSPSPTRLKSCAGQQRHHRVAVDQAEQRHLRTVEVGLQQHRVPAVEQGAWRAPWPRRGRWLTTTPLPGGQAVVLDHVGRGEAGQRGVEVGRVVDGLGAGGGHAGRGHHVLGEALGALDPGRGRARAEAGDSGGAHGVGDPGDQRHLGPDDDEIGPPAGGPAAAVAAASRTSSPSCSATAGGAGVARRAGQRGDRGVLRQGEDEGVLTGTGADDEDAHGSLRS